MTGNVKNCQNKLPSLSVCSFRLSFHPETTTTRRNSDRVATTILLLLLLLVGLWKWLGVAHRYHQLRSWAANWQGRRTAKSPNDNKLLFHWLYFHKQLSWRQRVDKYQAPNESRRARTGKSTERTTELLLGDQALSLSRGFCNNLSSETEQRLIFLPLCCDCGGPAMHKKVAYA